MTVTSSHDRVFTKAPVFTAPELTDYLHRHIPVSAAMGLAVAQIDWDGCTLVFPLRPNLNHNASAFGGSLSSALMLAGWSLVHSRLRHHGHDFVLVVSRSETQFIRPVEGNFRALSAPVAEKDWDFFSSCLERRGRGKLRLRTRVECEGQIAATMSGSFVAMTRETTSPA